MFPDEIEETTIALSDNNPDNPARIAVLTYPQELAGDEIAVPIEGLENAVESLKVQFNNSELVSKPPALPPPPTKRRSTPSPCSATLSETEAGCHPQPWPELPSADDSHGHRPLPRTRNDHSAHTN